MGLILKKVVDKPFLKWYNDNVHMNSLLFKKNKTNKGDKKNG